MKYHIYAKFIGTYMPEGKVRIGNCTILKSHDPHHWDDDRPLIPIRSKDTEFHCIEQGVKNYIHHPQYPISVRTFESEYIITTEVDEHSEYQALQTAISRFYDVSSSLSLVAKNKIVKVRNRRIRYADELYDFEIMGMFIKRNKRLIRVKLPTPSISGRNFFPKPLPKGFLTHAKIYLSAQDPIFVKAIVYFQRANTMRYSGIFNELDLVLNLIKCIELICWNIGEDDHFGLSKTKFKELGTKKVIELAGKKLGITKKTIKDSKEFWDARNLGDIVHKSPYFYPINKHLTHAHINYDTLNSAVAEFLMKYYKYRMKGEIRA